MPASRVQGPRGCKIGVRQIFGELVDSLEMMLIETSLALSGDFFACYDAVRLLFCTRLYILYWGSAYGLILALLLLLWCMVFLTVRVLLIGIGVA